MVTRALSHVTYQLELPCSWKIHNVFHASYLSPFKETKEHGINFLEPLPNIVEGQPKWEVEEIVGTRLFGKNKKRQYRVKWRGYSQAHDTWEPEENVFAEELIQRFKEKQRQTPSLTIRSARTRPIGDSMSQLVAGQFTTPWVSSPVPTPPIGTDPQSATSPIQVVIKEWTNEILKEVNEQLIEDVTCYTQQYTHHEVPTNQEGPQGPPSGQGSQHLPYPGPVGPLAFSNQGNDRVNLGHPLIPWGSPSNDPRTNRSLPWEAQDGKSLLSDPHLKALQELGITMFTMAENNNSNDPGPASGKKNKGT